MVGLTESDFALARYNTDGSLDNTFSDDGKLTSDFGAYDNVNSVAIQSDGKIVVAGSAIARYNKDGLTDVSFGNHGSITIQFNCNDIAIQSDGKILAVGESTAFYVARYNTNGSPDVTFDSDGIQTTDFTQDPDIEYTWSRSRSVAIQKDKKIVVAGYWVKLGYRNYSSAFALARYNTDGSLDNSFSDDGKQTTDFDEYAHANSATIQSDGKIVLAGSSGRNHTLLDENSHFSLARYNTDGSLDNNFSKNGIQITSISGQKDFISDITIANNKLYAVGYGEFAGSVGIAARYLLEENASPFVAITNPVNNAIFSGPATIKIVAKATAKNGKISKVQFYNGTALLATENVAPYIYTW